MATRKHKPFFVALDGEAIRDRYVLLGTSLDSYRLESREGITTDEALEFLVRLGSNRHLRKRSAVFVGFHFGYDIEMILRDFPAHLKDAIFHGARVWYKDYIIKAIKRKFISIRKLSDSYNNTNGITIYDVAGFWQGYNFEKVVKLILNYDSEQLTQGKQMRGAFTWENYETIKEYNKLECNLLCQVMDRVASMLELQGLTPRRWYGSSAVAATALRKWNISEEMRRTVSEKMPPHVYNALLCAYFGGRIEAIKLGTFKNVHAYDINSAYPSQIAKLWSNRGIWSYTTNYTDEPYSVWHVEFNLPKNAYLGILPFREKNGAIKFPLSGRGWYWKPEIDAVLERYPRALKFIEGYYHTERQETFLSKVVPELYERRQEYKRAGDLSEFILKITLNALYGKFAQKVGSADYKNFVWAGMITSATRAQLIRATFGREKEIIAFATDGIYSRVPLKVETSNRLGDWSHEKFAEASILMSGVYQLTSETRKRKTGERGFKHLVFDEILDALTDRGSATLTARLFVGFNLAHNFPNEYGKHYLKFIEQTKTLNPSNLDKRNYLIRQIKNWKKDFCDSLPVKSCKGESAPIATHTNELTAQDVIYREADEDIARLFEII